MTTATAVGSAFKRQGPPDALRYVIAAAMYGIGVPIVRTLEGLGLAQRVLSRAYPRQHQRILKENPFREYTPGKQDVFVATYAKSGTNWMMQIAHQLAFHGEGEYDHIHCVVPWPDTRAKSSPTWMREYSLPVDDPAVWQASPEKKRVIKTHFNWELIPYSDDARYIMVIRDPKDVFVSNYFFIQGALRAAMPSVDTWYKLFLSENFLVGGSWAVNAAGYWAQRHRPNVMVVSFKSMKKDLRGTVLKVADFMGVRASDEVIRKVCEKSSFEYMKRIDEKFRFWKMLPWGGEGTMIRKGTQGGSSELLSPERQREMDAYFIAELKRLNCDLPYEEFCDLSLA